MKRSIMMALVASASFLSYAWKEMDDPPVDRKKLLTMVGTMLEQKHYLTPVINDDFSGELWRTYISLIDNRKCILLQPDVDRLKVYKNYLDNEIHGDTIKFFPEITALYTRRYNETAVIYRQVLAQPFTFNKKDSIGSGQELVDYPKNKEEQLLRWHNNLKRATLEKLVELQEQRAQSKPGDSTYRKTDVVLEKQARESVLKQYERMLTRFSSLSEDKLFSSYVNVIAHDVDPHSDYFPPLDKQAFDQSMSNRFFGIGAQLKEEDGNIMIAGFDAGSPSWKSGAFAANDQIVKVGQGNDGDLMDVSGMALNEVVQLIRGNKGTVVRIGCRKADGRVIIVPLVREEIKPEETFARSAVIWNNGKKTGYIYLPVFYDDFEHPEGAHCADDVAREVTKLKAENVSSIIIDLRSNGGGSLSQVIKMVGLFIGNGPVVQVMTGAGSGEVLRSNQGEPLYTGPLTVMVNELSASASEIFAAAIQDYERGVIIGSATFGKGTVQRALPLEPDQYGALKLTIQKFYRINGGSTQQKGVIPDIILPDTYETLGLREGNKPAALGWDRVTPADYTPTGNVNISRLTAGLAVDSAFKVIADNNTWLENYLEERTHNMLLTQYKTAFLKRRKITKENEKIQELPFGKRMDVRPLPAVTGTTYQKWLESISKDIYIDEALKVSGAMIK